VSVLGHAFKGMLIGGCLGYFVLLVLLGFPFRRVHDLNAWLGLSLTASQAHWLYFACGAFVGALIAVRLGLVADARKWRLATEFHEATRAGGEKPAAEPAPDLEEKLKWFFSGRLELNNPEWTRVRGRRVGVADVFHTTTSVESSHTTGQTAAFYETPGLRFPSFMLQPEGPFLRAASAVLGIADIDFPSHPGFSRAYHLSAGDPEDTRELFTSSVLDELSRREGLYIQGEKQGILIYVPDELYGPAERAGFLGRAAEIFGLFEEAARAGGFTPDRAPRPVGDVKAMVEKMPGLIGMEARRTLFTRTDLEAFLRQPVPRTVPARAERYGERFALDGMTLFGVMFGLGGLAFMYLFARQAYWGKGFFSGDTLGFLLGLLCFSIGGPVLYFGVRGSRRIRRLLRRGTLGEGKIETILRTGGSVNGAHIYELSVRYRLQGRDVVGSCKITGAAAARAHKLVDRKQPARILYDPASPEQIFFLDALMSLPVDYDP
jgi:hypothetical protein